MHARGMLKHHNIIQWLYSHVMLGKNNLAYQKFNVKDLLGSEFIVKHVCKLSINLFQGIY